MENNNKTQDLYMLAIALVVLGITLILMAVRDNWVDATPVYILGSVVVLYSIWQLTEPDE